MGGQPFRQAAAAALSTCTKEPRGVVLRLIATGPINFASVDFTYPERADAPVLKCSVAIVCSAGSGKSTIATLPQRLYNTMNLNENVGSTIG